MSAQTVQDSTTATRRPRRARRSRCRMNLARRIARQLIDQYGFIAHDVWALDMDEDGAFDRQHPLIVESVIGAVIDHVVKMRPSGLGILVGTARFSKLPAGHFLGDTESLGTPGRGLLHDLAVAAIISEMLHIL